MLEDFSYIAVGFGLGIMFAIFTNIFFCQEDYEKLYNAKWQEAEALRNQLKIHIDMLGKEKAP